MQKAYPIGSGDTILQKTAITFDVSVWELFWWALTRCEGVPASARRRERPRSDLEHNRRAKYHDNAFRPGDAARLPEVCGSTDGERTDKQAAYVAASVCKRRGFNA